MKIQKPKFKETSKSNPQTRDCEWLKFRAAGKIPRSAVASTAPYTHFAVAAGILPAVEPGVPPGGKTHPCLGRLK
jgi:hypothetical protein